MKTIEEKAKAYDDAFERAKQIRNGNPSSGTAIVVCEQIFPELRESEDERIRKFLLEYAIEMIAGLESDISLSTYDGIKGHDPDAEAELAQWQKARAYLEKQKEQKPAEWSEDAIRKGIQEVGLTQHQIDWLRENVFPPIKQEWSEEDKQWLESIIREYEERLSGDKDHAAVIRVKINLLKSLRPSWKPSEEQMRALGDYIDGEEISEYDMEEIVRLYNDLLKLK